MGNYKIQEIIDNGAYVKMPFVSSTGASPTFSAITASSGFIGNGALLTGLESNTGLTGNFVTKSGDTMTGKLIINSDLEITGTTDLQGSVNITGITQFRGNIANTGGDIIVQNSVLPKEDFTTTQYNLGSSTKSFSRLYTNILALEDDSGGDRIELEIKPPNQTIPGGTAYVIQLPYTGSSVGSVLGISNSTSGAGATFETTFYSFSGVNVDVNVNTGATDTGGIITFSASTGGSGEINTASNVGAGEPVFKQKTGTDLEFRSLVAGANIQITSGTTSLTISGSSGGAGGEVNTASNVGNGSAIFSGKSGVDLQFRTLTGASPDYKITTAISGGTVVLDIHEPSMTLWPLVVSGNQLISGGASLLSGLTFNVSTLTYIIGETLYNASASTVTLNSGDTVNDRIDVIYADISGNTGFVEGTASPNPSKPALDNSTQVEITFVTVPAGASTPDVAITKIYDEATGTGGGEWDVESITANIFSASTIDAFSGTKSINFSAATDGDNILIANTVSYDTTDDNIISFYVKNHTDSWAANDKIEIEFFNTGGTSVSAIATLKDNTYGFDGGELFNWQVISIPLGDFSLTSNLVGKVQFTAREQGGSGKVNCFIDLIRFQAGAPTTSPQNIWYSFRGDDGNIVVANSSTDQLRLSGGTNITTTIDSASKTAGFSLTSGINSTFIGDGNVTNSEFDSLSAVTSDIQAQIDTKGTMTSFTFSGGSGTVETVTGNENIIFSGINVNTISSVGNIITISGSTGGGGGEVNTASNVGAGEPIFKQKTGVDLELRTLVAGTNVTITSGATSLTIAASSGAASAITETITVGENVVSGDLLYLSTDSKYWKVVNTAEATSSTELRLANATILADADGSSYVQGRYTTTSLTAGSKYWVGTSGSYTSVQPTGDGDIVRYIGTALSTTELEFNPDDVYIELSSTSGTGTQPGLRNVTTSQSISTIDFTLNVTSSGATTQTLPTAVGVIGKIYNIKNSGTGTVTIDTTSSQTIDGSLTVELAQYISRTVQSDNTNWIII